MLCFGVPADRKMLFAWMGWWCCTQRVTLPGLSSSLHLDGLHTLLRAAISQATRVRVRVSTTSGTAAVDTTMAQCYGFLSLVMGCPVVALHTHQATPCAEGHRHLVCDSLMRWLVCLIAFVGACWTQHTSLFGPCVKQPSRWPGVCQSRHIISTLPCRLRPSCADHTGCGPQGLCTRGLAVTL